MHSNAVTFTPNNWNTPQMITIMAMDDLVDDGEVVYQITGATSSSDPSYNSLATPVMSVTNIDDDVAGVLITQSGKSTRVNDALEGMQFNPTGSTGIIQIAVNTQSLQMSMVNSDPKMAVKCVGIDVIAPASGPGSGINPVPGDGGSTIPPPTTSPQSPSTPPLTALPQSTISNTFARQTSENFLHSGQGIGNCAKIDLEPILKRVCLSERSEESTYFIEILRCAQDDENEYWDRFLISNSRNVLLAANVKPGSDCQNDFSMHDKYHLLASTAVVPKSSNDNLLIQMVTDTQSMVKELQALVDPTEKIPWLSKISVGTAIGVGAGLSAGYLMMVFRYGALLTGSLVTFPVWQWVDPLPILETSMNKSKRQNNTNQRDGDFLEDSLENIVP